MLATSDGQYWHCNLGISISRGKIMCLGVIQRDYYVKFSCHSLILLFLFLSRQPHFGYLGDLEYFEVHECF